MTIKQNLQNDLKVAMRDSDRIRRDTIRMALTSLKLAEVEQGHELDESAVINIINKELKNHQEALENAKTAERLDLIEENQNKIKILTSYMPEPYSEDEIIVMAKNVISELGAISKSDMGKVMKVLLPRLEGRARGDQVSHIVIKLLQDT